jgi:hypothetical protein
MTFSERAIGAARLDVRVFEEIEADQHATGQALTVVVLSSLAAGIGLSFGAYDAPVWSRIALALVSWVFWAGLTYAIGVHLIPEAQTSANVGELLRTIGFAASPGILRILGFIPLLGGLIYLIASAWMLVAVVVAIRQALDYKSTVRAVVVCLISWFVAMTITALFGAILFLSVGTLIY